MLNNVFKSLLGLVTLTACLGFPVSALAVKWEVAAKSTDPSVVIYVDTDSLKKSGEFVYAWTDFILLDHSGNKIAHVRTFRSTNCSNRQYRDREIYGLADGKVVIQEKLGDRAELGIATHGSLMGDVADYVCGR